VVSPYLEGLPLAGRGAVSPPDASPAPAPAPTPGVSGPRTHPGTGSVDRAARAAAGLAADRSGALRRLPIAGGGWARAGAGAQVSGTSCGGAPARGGGR
jgi:hypothetical protein